MRRFLIPALMISLLLTGCGASGAAVQRKVEEQRDRTAKAAEITFSADVTENLGNEAFNCTLNCAAGPETVTAEVVSPASVAGIRAKTENGGTMLEYESISLAVGTAGTEGLSPFSAVPLLVNALRAGFIQRCWTERTDAGELIAAEIYATDAAALTVWFNAADMTPVHCDFLRDGSVALRCEIRDYSMREMESRE